MASVDELAARLRAAAEAVDRADLAADLRPIGFEVALRTLASDTASPVSEQPEALITPIGGAAQGGSKLASSDRALSLISKRLGIEHNVLERIYEDDDGEVRLAVQRGMLPQPNSKAASMRDVALLTVVGRQAADVDDATQLAVVREECSELRVLDGPNFSAEINKLGLRMTGTSRNRAAKAKRHHFEDAAELIRRMSEGAAS